MNIEIDNIIIEKGNPVIHFTGKISMDELDELNEYSNKIKCNIIGSSFIEQLEDRTIKYKNRMDSRKLARS